MKYMLDTNICIYIIKNKPHRVIDTFKRKNAGDICLSVITLAELKYGVEKSHQRKRNQVALLGFLSPLQILPFTEKAARNMGK